MNSPILPILTLKLVAMATSLEPLEKGSTGNLRSNTYTNGENLVKIGPVYPEFVLLKG